MIKSCMEDTHVKANERTNNILVLFITNIPLPREDDPTEVDIVYGGGRSKSETNDKLAPVLKKGYVSSHHCRCVVTVNCDGSKVRSWKPRCCETSCVRLDLE
jgi:hypothetical protein